MDGITAGHGGLMMALLQDTPTLRERCVSAALLAHAAAGLDPSPRHARAGFDATAALIRAAALRDYADAEHRLADDGRAQPRWPGADADEWCSCGSVWVPGEGCTERQSLLAAADLAAPR